jgi:hypothetical protein
MKVSSGSLRPYLLVLMGTSLLPQTARAQVPLPEPGRRVRVSTNAEPTPSDWVAGTWLSLSPDELILEQPDGKQVRLARNRLIRIQVSRGRRSRWALGAGVGLAAGFGVGALVEAALCSGKGERPACVSNGYMIFGAVGAGLGALTGGMVGSNMVTETWQDVPAERIGVGLGMVEGRIVAGVALRW